MDVYPSWNMDNKGNVTGSFTDSKLSVSGFIRRFGDGLVQREFIDKGPDFKIISANYAMKWSKIIWRKIGRVNVNVNENVVDTITVMGERDDLLKVIVLFGELRGDGDYKEIVYACCEMTVL